MIDGAAQDKILALFRDGTDRFVSSDELCRLLGVSRTAIWKQMERLRGQGYIIEAIPSRGYRLRGTPDNLLPAEIAAELGTTLIGREIVFLEETDSTNLQAHEQGEAGGRHGLVVVADRQTAGKGRLGRQWVSPPGVNFYASVLLRPTFLPRQAPQLTFLSAVAVARAVQEVAGLSARVKWPNDVLVGGRKIAGLLNEMSAETERIHYVILGIGVNLNMRAEQFPKDLRYPATSILLETGAPVSRTAFARALLRHLDSLYALYLAEGFPPLRHAWEAHFDLVGREVEVDFRSTLLRGVVEGIDAEGALLLRREDGQLEKVLAGDVRPLNHF
jgi:BirA family transcriptional regulator, biotin operon repressor / biotin---[acetyl-CoA-carboxylase] ligase